MLRLLFGGQGLSPQPREQVKTGTVCVRLPQSAEQKYACMIDGRRVMVRYLDIILLSYCDAVCFYKCGHFEIMLFMYCMQQQQLLTGNLLSQLWGRQP